MTKLLLTVLLVFLSALPSLCYSQTVTQAWVRFYNGASIGGDQPRAIALDPSQNVIVSGSKSSAYPASAQITLKYNPAGALQWIGTYKGPFNTYDRVGAMATDASGNIYVAGVSSNGNKSMLTLIKYNPSGVLQWAINYDKSEAFHEDPVAIAVDAAANIYLTGTINSSLSDYNYLTLKYNTSGVLQWEAFFNGAANGNDFAASIAVDAKQNVYVTGESQGLYMGRSSGFDYATVKYDKSGVQQWVQVYNPGQASDDRAEAIALDPSGDVYVTGYSSITKSNYDYATIKYKSSGEQIWVQRYNSPYNLSDYAQAMAVDGSGNVHVTGTSRVTSTTSDYITVKYNTNGGLLWSSRYDAGFNTSDNATVVKLDNTGNVYVTGQSFTSAGSDFATVRYGSNGVQVWVIKYQSIDQDIPAGMVIANSTGPVAAQPAVYVTGVSNSDFATIKYTQALSGARVASAPLTLNGIFSSENTPNPFRSTTTIRYSIPEDSRVSLNVFDVTGRKVATLVDADLKAGAYQNNFSNNLLNQKVFFYTLNARSAKGELRETKTMSVLK